MDKRALDETAKYDVIWRGYPSYREYSPWETGEVVAPFFFEGFKGEILSGQTLINFGRATARVAKDFLAKGLNTTLVGISPCSLDEELRSLLFSNQIHFVQACLWKLPESLKSAHWIYCCNVLEHIPEGYIDSVLEAMAKKMRFGGYFSICLQKDLAAKKSNPPLHLTVKKKAWWEEKILKHFSICGEDVIADDLYFNCRLRVK